MRTSQFCTFAGLFDYSTGIVLLSVRKIIEQSIDSKKQYFPLDDLMMKLGDKKLSITTDVLDKMMGMQYGDTRIEPLLREVIGDRSTKTYQVDHIWARAYMESKKKCEKVIPKINDDTFKKYRDSRNYLANLELITDGDNESKGDMLFDEWYRKTEQDDQFIKQHCIPQKKDGSMYTFNEYFEFLEKREQLLREAIKEALPENYNEIADKYNF